MSNGPRVIGTERRPRDPIADALQLLALMISVWLCGFLIGMKAERHDQDRPPATSLFHEACRRATGDEAATRPLPAHPDPHHEPR